MTTVLWPVSAWQFNALELEVSPLMPLDLQA